MEILALIILILFSLAGFCAVFFTTFGTLIIFLGSLLYVFLTGFSIVNLKSLIVLLILYLIGEVLEYFLVIFGAKKFGASNAAVIGALLGGVLGAIFGVSFLGIGVILGAFLGVFLGAFIVELFIQKDLVKSLKAGGGSLLGRFSSIFLKVIIAGIMFVILISRIINYS